MRHEVLRTRGGWGDHGRGECATSCKQRCWAQLDPAHWRVISRDPAPVIETTAPTRYGEQVDDPDATAPERNRVRWRYQGDAHRFVAEAHTRFPTQSSHDVCAPLPLRSPLP